MSSDSRSDNAYGREVQSLLSWAIRDEVAVSSGIHGLPLSDEDIGRLTDAVWSRLDYDFRFAWAPAGVPMGGPHIWSENGQTFARCTACLHSSPGSGEREAAEHWHATHDCAERR